MAQTFTLLFADPNKHIRELLRREFEREGYGVQVAATAKEVSTRIQSGPLPDVLVIDPDLPLVEGLELLKEIEEGAPDLPVIIHTGTTEIYTHPATRTALLLLEKTGNLDPLKRAVAEVCRARAPSPAEGTGDPDSGAAEPPAGDHLARGSNRGQPSV